MTAALIDQLMCRHCWASLVADVEGPPRRPVVTYQGCPCRASTPAEATARGDDVARRHHTAVERAQLREWARRGAARNRRAER